jgi:hypothetical protein
MAVPENWLLAISLEPGPGCSRNSLDCTALAHSIKIFDQKEAQLNY